MPKKKPKLSLTWDRATNRYRDSQGRFLSRNAVLDVRDRIISDAESQLVNLSEDFRDGKITLAQWQTEFKDIIRAGHTLAAGIAMGGKKNMTSADWGRIGQQLRVQYESLNRFALQLESGRAMHLGRVKLYARAIRMTFLNSERLRIPVAKLARWVRTRGESCAGCISQASRGVQPIGSFPLIGSNECRVNCRCFISTQV